MKHYLVLNTAKDHIDSLLSGEKWWLPFSCTPYSFTPDTICWRDEGFWVLLQERGSGGKIRAVAQFKYYFASGTLFPLAARLKQYEAAPDKYKKGLAAIRDLLSGSSLMVKEIDDFCALHKNGRLWKLVNVRAFDAHVSQYYLDRAVSTYRFVYGEEVCAIPSSHGEMVTLRGCRERESRITAAINYGRALERLVYARIGCSPGEWHTEVPSRRKLVVEAWKARKEASR